MPAAARSGDAINCGDTLAGGSPDSFINGSPIIRVGIDLSTGHGPYPPVLVATGSPTVFVNGYPMARVGDPMVTHHPPSIPVIGVGSPDVNIN